MLGAVSGRRSHTLVNRAGHDAIHQRQDLRSAVRDLELLVDEVNQPHMPSPTSDLTPVQPSPRTPDVAARREEADGGSPTPSLLLARLPTGLSLCLSSVLLYAKLALVTPNLSWLIPLAPLWASGMMVLLSKMIPRMLVVVEKALSQQRDRDSRHNAPMRGVRMSVREWDEMDQAEQEAQCGPCCQCGLWTQALRSILLSLSLAMVLGFLMMTSLQLEIRFLPWNRVWETTVPLFAGEGFALIACLSAALSPMAEGMRLSTRAGWGWGVLMSVSSSLSSALVLRNAAAAVHKDDPWLGSNRTVGMGAEHAGVGGLDASRVVGETAAKLAFAVNAEAGGGGAGVAVGAWAAALAPLVLASAVPIPFLVAAACRKRGGLGGEGYEMAPLGTDGFGSRGGPGGVRRPHTRQGEQGIFALAAVNVLGVLALACTGGYLELGAPALLQAAFGCSFGAGAVWALFGHVAEQQQQAGDGRAGAASARWEDVATHEREEVAHRVAAEVEYLVQIGVSRDQAGTQVRERMARLLLHPRRQQPPPENAMMQGESYIGGEPPPPLDGGVGGAVWTEDKGGSDAAPAEEGMNLRSAFEERGIPVPDAFLCPISMEVMSDPVILTDGHVYERKTIERWLLSHDTSPKTNQVVATDQLIPCHALRTVIQDFVETHRHLICEVQDADQIAEVRK